MFKSTNSQFITTLFRVSEQVTEQVTEQVAEQVLNMLNVIQSEQLLAKDIMHLMGLNQREYFRADILTPALEQGLVARTLPDKPRSPKQKYYLTDLGLAVLNHLKRSCSQTVAVDSDEVQRFIAELQESVGNISLQLPPMSDRYAASLKNHESRCFKASYKHEKKFFTNIEVMTNKVGGLLSGLRSYFASLTPNL